MEIVKKPVPPTGLARLLFRLPIHLYRLRLGWVVGSRLMLLTHLGRVSGKRRHVVIGAAYRSSASPRSREREAAASGRPGREVRPAKELLRRALPDARRAATVARRRGDHSVICDIIESGANPGRRRDGGEPEGGTPASLA